MHVNKKRGCSCSALLLILLFLYTLRVEQLKFLCSSQAPLAHNYSWLAILIASDGSHLLLLGSLAHPREPFARLLLILKWQTT